MFSLWLESTRSRSKVVFFGIELKGKRIAGLKFIINITADSKCHSRLQMMIPSENESQGEKWQEKIRNHDTK